MTYFFRKWCIKISSVLFPCGPFPYLWGTKLYMYLRLFPSNFSSWGGHLSLLLPFSPSLCLCNLPFLLLSVPKRSLHYKNDLRVCWHPVFVFGAVNFGHMWMLTHWTQTANYSQWLETCLRGSGMRIRVGILMMHVARIWHRKGWRSSGAQGISSPKTKNININIFIFIFNLAVLIFLLKYQHSHITSHCNIFTNIHHGTYDHPIY